MKNEIYNEIKTMENSHNDFQKRKGRMVRILADSITCFKCIDTKRAWKNRDISSGSSPDDKGNYDIIGCCNCNNVGFICCSNTNYFTQNGFKVFNANNNNWLERIEEIYNKASRDTNIINQVNKWVLNVKILNVELGKSKTELLKIEPEKAESTRPDSTKAESMPLFEVCKRITKDYTEKSLDVNIEVGKIIDIVKNAVEIYFGNAFSLTDLAKELRVSFTSSNNQSIITDKLIKIKDNNYLGIKTCTRVTQKIIKTGLFGRNKFAKEYTADIFILKPLNQKAIDKALFIMGKIGEEMTDNILKEF
jgi:hypothetical protein